MNRQEELEGMSHFEINKLVAPLSGKKYHLANGIFWGISPFASPMTTYNWCKNPEDIMPLAIENKISLLLDESDLPEATTNPLASLVSGCADDCISSLDMNIYRAICIVLILMKEAENA